MAARKAYFLRTVFEHPLASFARLSLTGLGILGVPDSKLAGFLLHQPPTYRGGSILERLQWLRELGWLGVWLALGVVTSLVGFGSIPWLVARSRLWDGGRRALLALCLILALYHLFISSFIMYQSERFRVPIIPLLAVFVGVALFGNQALEPWHAQDS